MEKTFSRIAWFIALVLVQVLILNHIFLFSLATPFLYIYFILVLDKNIDRIPLMLMAFALGLAVDVCSNTPGVNAGAAVLLAFTRTGLLGLFAPRDEFDNYEPGIYTIGIWSFVRYAFVATLLHHTALFMLESFSVLQIGYLTLRILCSTLLTVMLVMSIEFIRHRQ